MFTIAGGRCLIAVRKATIFAFLLCFVSQTMFAGLSASKSEYVGGTTVSIPANTLGVITTDDPKTMTFKFDKADKKKQEASMFMLNYDKVTALSYGQHAGRRVGATVALGVTTLGIGALPMLFSKKRRHYLTLEYTDADNKQQAAVFELGKDAIRTTIKSLEVRTGKTVQYEDDEARKAGNK